MRTNIVIDDALLNKAMREGHYKTKKETVHAGLRLLRQYQRQAKIKGFRGKLFWEGSLETMRTDK
ncbi:MAG TPA: type II toxin-antitoxin system VapB family antitoxin [Gammaproteobacteria bacterium]|nr:type II toxin-antitoxin system VapB family antitoxin [Gammaproteobacteria bacterium]